ncbi:MAG TPA: DMT family transporter [Gemmatimonadaceae bacterium]|nr:DMT family transporter [Gemmatimonadaceae bacterium]
MASRSGAVAPGSADPIARPGVSTTDLMLLGMSIIWGVNFSVVKYGTTQLAPLAFNGIRMTIAVLTLGALVWARGGLRLSWRDARSLLVLGLLGNGLYQILFIEGIARTRAGTVALILAAGPAFAALIGRVMGVERVSARGWGGIALSLAGIALVTAGTPESSSGSTTFMGNTLVLAGALCWATFSVLLKPYANRIGAVQLGSVTMLGGLLPLLVVASPSLAAVSWGAMPPGVWLALIYSGFGALAVAGLFWLRGVRVLGPTRTAMYVNLQPAMALLVAWWALNEVPTAAQWGGAGAIIAGVLLTRS